MEATGRPGFWTLESSTSFPLTQVPVPAESYLLMKNDERPFVTEPSFYASGSAFTLQIVHLINKRC